MVDLTLPQGASFQATAAEAGKLEAVLAHDPNVVQSVAYIGGGTARFFLTFDEQLQNANLAQFVVLTKGLKERDVLKRSLEARADRDFPAAPLRASPLELGPPVGYPVQFRVSGDDPAKVRAIAYQVRDRLLRNSDARNVNLDWDELAKRVKVAIDPAKARALGVSKKNLSQALDLMLTGTPITQYREGTDLIDVVVRTPAAERIDLSELGDLTVSTAGGGVVPVSQVATLSYELEEPILWRRSRDITMSVRADVTPGVQPPVVTARVDAELADIKAALPDGYRIELGGATEASGKGQGAIIAMLPLMVLIMLGTLMLQLQSFSRVALVLLTAPLGVIGVSAALLISGRPFGFVALLGVIALAGIIMRNSVILVDQIDQDIRAGNSGWDAIVGATVRRSRPILLTAAAAILAMIPLAGSVFWGPMAIAIMGGLAVATILTLFFMPALYAAWFAVRAPASRDEAPSIPDYACAAE